MSRFGSDEIAKLIVQRSLDATFAPLHARKNASMFREFRVRAPHIATPLVVRTLRVLLCDSDVAAKLLETIKEGLEMGMTVECTASPVSIPLPPAPALVDGVVHLVHNVLQTQHDG
tara:strand:- start:1434 stop:1781 length:348 start_codon:yes stop_codon:yes gene_type:complete